MTFEEALSEANDQGWYLYQLSQEESLNEWTCCLRALSGGHRREISRGSGPDPAIAICNALGSAPELEREVSTSGVSEADVSALADFTRLFHKPRERMRRV